MGLLVSGPAASRVGSASAAACHRHGGPGVSRPALGGCRDGVSARKSAGRWGKRRRAVSQAKMKGVGRSADTRLAVGRPARMLQEHTGRTAAVGWKLW